MTDAGRAGFNAITKAYREVRATSPLPQGGHTLQPDCCIPCLDWHDATHGLAPRKIVGTVDMTEVIDTIRAYRPPTIDLPMPYAERVCCTQCDVELLVANGSGRIEHHDDGSHTYHPA